MDPSAISSTSAVLTHESCQGGAGLGSHFRDWVRERSDVVRPERKIECSGAGLGRPLRGP